MHPLPLRRVAALQRVRVVQVAAANKHSAAITSGGEVYTWGANGEGQLGYGTSDSAANPTPRMVEALKVSFFVCERDIGVCVWCGGAMLVIAVTCVGN